MEDKLTAKEIETFKFLHDFRKNVEKGEITIVLHNRDFSKLKNIQCEFILTGNTASVDFYNKMQNLFGLPNIEV